MVVFLVVLVETTFEAGDFFFATDFGVVTLVFVLISFASDGLLVVLAELFLLAFELVFDDVEFFCIAHD